jgi:hypothetical protein
LKTIISAGVLLKKTWGPLVDGETVGGMAFFTSSQFWLAGSFDISSGSLPATVQGPSRAEADSQVLSFSR